MDTYEASPSGNSKASYRVAALATGALAPLATEYLNAVRHRRGLTVIEPLRHALISGAARTFG